MAYVKTNWVNGLTPVNSTNLNKIEDGIEANDTLKAPLASPALTGTPTAPTQADGNDSTRLATTAYVMREANKKAPLASPALTGTPTAPTQSDGNNSTRLATTAYVMREANKKANLSGGNAFTGLQTVDGSQVLTKATTTFPDTAILLGAGTNLNFLDPSGQYVISGATNRPPSFTGFGYYEVIRHENDWIMQRATDLSNDTGVWVRIKQSGVWLPWRRLSQDTGLKTTTLVRTSWLSGNAGTNFVASHHYILYDADFIVGDVVDFEVGYGNNFNDIPVAERAGMYNTTISSFNGGFLFMTRSLPDTDLQVKYRINKG